MPVSLLTERHSDYRRLSLFLTISLIGHLTVLAAFVVSPLRSEFNNSSLPAIQVDLIAPGLPDGDPSKPPVSAPAASVAAPATEAPAASRAEEPPPPAPSKEDIVFKTKKAPPKPKEIAPASPPAQPKEKTSLKRKTYKPSEVAKNAVSRMEKKISDDSSPNISGALGRMRQQVAAGPPGGRGAGGQRGGGTGTPGSDEVTQIDIYRAEINFYIKQNWNFSEHLAGGRSDLTVSYWIRVQKNGEISKVAIDKSSGNNYTDESAYRAIVKSNPLPPLPDGYPYSYYEVPLHFDPSELHQLR